MSRLDELAPEVAAGWADDAETLVFINYRTRDSSSAAALLHAEMADRFGPEAVFLDYESIRLGRDFEPELLARLRGSAILLVVVGDRWLDGEIGHRPIDSPDDWVRREILEALEHDIPVVPVLFPGATLDPERLPADLEMLAKRQRYEVHRRQRSDIRALGEYLVSQIPRLADQQARRCDGLLTQVDVTELREPGTGRVRYARTAEMITGTSRPTALIGLPPAVPVLVGRDAELTRLAGMLRPRDSDDSSGSALVVISGLAGVGKTALALSAAHRAWRAGWFPGGVLMIDMLGYDSPEHCVPPERALGSMLGNLGVMGEHLPADGQGRERLWRTVLAERATAGERMLIIIDNVSSADQVCPLLPGVPPHEVLVTSRHTLADIESAALIRLGVLNLREAAALLRQQLIAADVDDDRAFTQAPEIEQIARMCGGLPLAIRIAGALLAADQEQPLAEMVGTLADECARLEELSYDGSFAVRSAFDLSYRQLGEGDAQLFRLLAVHLGREFPTEMANVVLGERRRGGLQRLHRANLIEAGGIRGRWRMHDLVRLYAQHLAMNDPDRGVVIRRITDHYLRLCGRAHQRLNTPSGSPVEGGEMNEVLRGIDLDLANLVATVTQAYETGLDGATIELAEAMFTYFDLRKCWDAWIEVDQLALLSAVRTGDVHAASRIRLNLGIAFRDQGRFDEALGCCDQALAYFREAGDCRREAEALNNLAVVLRKCGRLDEALAELSVALAVWQRLRDALGQARALNNMGLVHLTAGAYNDAVECFGRALDLVRTTDDERRRAKVLHNYGVVCLRLGRFAEAADRLALALELRRNLGDRYREAKTLAMLGTVKLELGEAEEGNDMLRRALAVFGELGDQRWAGKVVAYLAREA